MTLEQDGKRWDFTAVIGSNKHELAALLSHRGENERSNQMAFPKGVDVQQNREVFLSDVDRVPSKSNHH